MGNDVGVSGGLAQSQSIGVLTSNFDLSSTTSRYVSRKKRNRDRALHVGHLNQSRKDLDVGEFRNSLKSLLHDGEERPQHRFEALPLIKGKYQVLRMLGKGFFGVVLKVRDVTTKEMFAMKCINVVGGTQEQKKIVESANIELSILPNLKHPSIVGYVESFYTAKNPIRRFFTGDSEDEKNHLCMVMKFVRGSDMNALLKFSEEKKLYISGLISIKWLLTLLDTIQYFHAKGVIHRDLKPDNVLMEYDSLEDLSKVELIITDFGVGKTQSHYKAPEPRIERSESEEKMEEYEAKFKTDLFGHLYFAPPECLRQETFNATYDVWSLGIMFFQMYCGISIESYQKKVNALRALVKNDPKLRSRFCEYLAVKSGGVVPKVATPTNVSVLDLLSFIHEKGLVTKKILELFLKEDSAMSELLNRMICPMDTRFSSKDLQMNTTIQTWKTLIGSYEKKRDVDQMDIEFELSIPAFITLFKVVKNKLDLYYYLIKNLKKCICTSKLTMFFISTPSALETVIGKSLLFPSHEKENLLVLIDLLLPCMEHDTRVHSRVLCIFREYCLLDIVKDTLLRDLEAPDILYEFVLTVFENATCLCYFRDIYIPLVDAFYKSGKKTGILKIAQMILPKLTSLPEELLVTIDDPGSLVMFGSVNWRIFDKKGLAILVEKTGSVMDLVSKKLKDEHSVGLVVNMLEAALFSGMEEEVPQSELEFKSSVRGELELDVFEEDMGKMPNVDYNRENVFICQGIQEGYAEQTLLTSNKALCEKFEFGDEENVVVAYYENEVRDGGSNDLLELGLCINERICYFVSGLEGKIKCVKLGDTETVTIDVNFKSSTKSLESVQAIVGTKGEMEAENVDDLFYILKKKLDASSVQYLELSSNEWIDVDITDPEDWEAIPKDTLKVRVVKSVESTEAMEFCDFSQLLCCTGDVVGVGLTKTGKMFITKNRKVVGEKHVELDKDYLVEGAKITGMIRVTTNDFFCAKTRFSGPFKFPFKNSKMSNEKCSFVGTKDRKMLVKKLTKVKKLKSVTQSFSDRIDKLIDFLK